MTNIKQLFFYKLLKEQAQKKLKKTIYLGLVAGLFQGLSIFLLLQSLGELLTQSRIQFHHFFLFMICCAGFYYSFRKGLQYISELAVKGISDWRTRLAVKIRGIDKSTFQKISPGEIQNVLLDDRIIFIEASRMVVVGISSVIMIMIALFKMMTISMSATFCIIGTVIVLFFMLTRSSKALVDKQSDIFQHEATFGTDLNSVIDGFSELKLNYNKSSELYQTILLPEADVSRELKTEMEHIYTKGMSLYQLFSFLVLGLALFILPKLLGIPAHVTGQILMLTIFCLSPLLGMVFFIPAISKAEMSLAQLAFLEEKLDASAEPFEKINIQNNWSEKSIQQPPFNKLTLENIEFHYTNQFGEQSFSIAIDLFELVKGETVFIRGGNGSGKTTLMQVIAGLYPPSTGILKLNNKTVNESNIEQYRNLFSTVFTDFYTFKKPIGISKNKLQQMDDILEKMHLTNKVYLQEDGTFSTIDLSTGQKKRLALACSLLEEREVYLFDEVAADFDPEFREYFYRSFLKELKNTGATILTISHDDRYFDVADRIISMDMGKIVNETT